MGVDVTLGEGGHASCMREGRTHNGNGDTSWVKLQLRHEYSQTHASLSNYLYMQVRDTHLVSAGQVAHLVEMKHPHDAFRYEEPLLKTVLCMSKRHEKTTVSLQVQGGRRTQRDGGTHLEGAGHRP